MARKMFKNGEPDLKIGEEQGKGYDFDLFIIGAGSGGVRDARFSSNFGEKVRSFILSLEKQALASALSSLICFIAAVTQKSRPLNLVACGLRRQVFPSISSFHQTLAFSQHLSNLTSTNELLKNSVFTVQRGSRLCH
ncbi:hypothetical protein RYX36_007783 [Vicia faba]